MLCFPTQIKVGIMCVKDPVLRLEHTGTLRLMEILKNLERYNNFLFFFEKNIYSRPFNSRIEGTREIRILMGLQYSSILYILYLL